MNRNTPYKPSNKPHISAQLAHLILQWVFFLNHSKDTEASQVGARAVMVMLTAHVQNNITLLAFKHGVSVLFSSLILRRRSSTTGSTGCRTVMKPLHSLCGLRTTFCVIMLRSEGSISDYFHCRATHMPGIVWSGRVDVKQSEYCEAYVSELIEC